MNADWLSFGNTPTMLTESSLWHQFIEDPSKGFKPSALGRPKKRDEKHEYKAKKVTFIEDDKDIKKKPALQDDVDTRLNAYSSRLHRANQSNAQIKQKLDEC